MVFSCSIMSPAWRIASFAAPAWSSGTWCVVKREGCGALVNGSAKDTVCRVVFSSSAIRISGAVTSWGTLLADAFLLLLRFSGSSSSSSSGRLITVLGGATEKDQDQRSRVSRLRMVLRTQYLDSKLLHPPSRGHRPGPRSQK